MVTWWDLISTWFELGVIALVCNLTSLPQQMFAAGTSHLIYIIITQKLLQGALGCHMLKLCLKAPEHSTLLPSSKIEMALWSRKAAWCIDSVLINVCLHVRYKNGIGRIFRIFWSACWKHVPSWPFSSAKCEIGRAMRRLRASLLWPGLLFCRACAVSRRRAQSIAEQSQAKQLMATDSDW